MYDLHLYYAFLFIYWVPLDVVNSGFFIELSSMLLSITGRPAFVGEWSLALPWYGRVREDLNAMTLEEKDAMRVTFATRQINGMTRHGRLGGYVWTWHAPDDSDKPNWSLQHMLSQGFIQPGQWAAAPSVA